MASGVREISRRTGLSPATVSNALNRKYGVSKETADRVWAAAADLGYLGKGKSADSLPSAIDAIRLVVFRKSGLIVDNSSFRSLIEEGIEIQTRRHGLNTHLSICDVSDRDSFALQAEKICQDRGTANVLLATEMSEQDYDPFVGSDAAIVLIDSFCRTHPFEAIIADDETGAWSAVMHLIERGHTRIGHLGGSAQVRSFPLRRAGLIRALEESGLAFDERFEVSVGASLEDSYNRVSEWLAGSPELPSSFFADNDMIAVGAMRAFSERGIRVPDDISLIGFDDLDFAAFTSPGLTTMRVPIREMGEMAVRKAVRQARTPRDYRSVTHVCTTLVERGSVADLR